MENQERRERMVKPVSLYVSFRHCVNYLRAQHTQIIFVITPVCVSDYKDLGVL